MPQACTGTLRRTAQSRRSQNRPLTKLTNANVDGNGEDHMTTYTGSGSGGSAPYGATLDVYNTYTGGTSSVSIYSKASGTNSTGVYAEGAVGPSAASAATAGSAVYGSATGTNGRGVAGNATASGGTGVYGT